MPQVQLPAEIIQELHSAGEHRGWSAAKTFRECMKIGLVALKVDADPQSVLIIRETFINKEGDVEIKDRQIVFGEDTTG